MKACDDKRIDDSVQMLMKGEERRRGLPHCAIQRDRPPDEDEDCNEDEDDSENENEIQEKDVNENNKEQQIEPYYIDPDGNEVDQQGQMKRKRSTRLQMEKRKSARLYEEKQALQQQLEDKYFLQLGCDDMNKKGSMYEMESSLTEQRRNCRNGKQKEYPQIGDKLLHHWYFFMTALTSQLEKKARIPDGVKKQYSSRTQISLIKEIISNKFYSNKNLYEKNPKNNCCTHRPFINKAVRWKADKKESAQYYCPKLHQLCLFITAVAYFKGFCEVPKNQSAQKSIQEGFLYFANDLYST
jgi:hypothetical protein